MKILESGEIQNQHQSKRSSGAYDPAERKRVEQIIYGDHPIYGSIMDDEDGGRNNPALDEYGDVDIVFKPEIRKRTTMFFGDSLEPFQHKIRHPTAYVGGTPCPIDNPDHTCVRPASVPGLLDDTGISEIMGQVGYIETQIHGRVTRNDIEKVVIYAPNKQVEDICKKYNIPVVIESGE